MDKEELYRAWDELGPEMNPGERMMKYFSGEEVDCIPYGLLAAEDALCGKVPLFTPWQKVGFRLFTVGSIAEYLVSLVLVLLAYIFHLVFVVK